MSAPQPDLAAQLRAAYLALKKQQARIAELEAAQAAAREPIAIVGIGCRFPGGVRGPEVFWEKLRAGFDAVAEVPPERWPVETFYDADPEKAGKIYTRHGAFLDEVDKFDARFFGISPREAMTMDPQQRLLLETAWEAFEHAGIVPASVAGSATGVFVGLTVIDYLKLIYRDDLTRLDTYAATGNVANIAAGRLSYFFGLRGPAVTLDTACSSSLVAVHLACQSLRTGESTLAIAAGVNLILAPDNSVAVSRARMLAPDGRCKTFDAAADGYARGEGCGVVILKPLAKARWDGDRVLAVIRGSAVAQDGARSGLTVPNGPAQAALLRQALANAAVAPAEVGYLEAHGTGTSLGDPIETEALASVFGRDPARAQPLVLGSLKTNVGHMESAAGIGGVIKAALAVRHGEIPPHLHFTRENPELRLAEIPAEVPVRLRSWPSGARRVAGVSSFGSCGTIAHVVIEGVEKPAAARGPAEADGPCVLFLSAKTPAALERLAAQYVEFLRVLPSEVSLHDVCWTAAVGRTHFECRRVVVGRTAAELAAAVERGGEPVFAQGSKWAEVSARYLAGGLPDWAEVFGGGRRERVSVPTYPFARDRHWVEGAEAVLSDGSDKSDKLDESDASEPSDGGHALQFGIMYFNGTEQPGADSYRALVEAARFADAHGFSSVWLPERHFTKFGAVYPNPATLHAALARETRRVRLMAGSSVLPLHHPLRLVEEWSVVDNLSRGRVGISFASGWNPADFALAPDAYPDRQDALFRGIPQLQRLWRGEALTLRGGDGREVSVRAYPTPVQPELPLWVTAAGNPRTFERAGELGANLLTHLLDQDPDELAEKIATYRAVRARAGHDPAAGRVTVMLHTFLGRDAESVHAAVRGPFTRYLKENLHLLRGLAASRGREVDFNALPEAEREAFVGFIYERFATSRALLGTPEACAPLVRRLAAAGVSEIACLLDFGPADDAVLAMLPELAAFRAKMSAELSVNVGALANSTPTSLVAQRGLEHGYDVAWRAVQLLPKPLSAAQPQRWLVALDRGGVGVKFAERLRSLGQTVATLAPEAAVPGSDARIVNFRPLDPAASLLDTLALVQGTTGRIWTVTRGAQPAGEVAPEPRAAAHWGLLRVLPVEQPTRWGGLIDLDPTRDFDAQLEALLAAITTASREDQLALRGDSVFAARLAPRSTATSVAGPDFRVRPDATYLITGGLGGIGWSIAQWLVERGARSLLLVGRSAPSREREVELAAWRAAGVRVQVTAADVGRLEDVKRVLAEHRASGVAELRGVFHAAGTWADVELAALTPEKLNAVWGAKADGAAHLDALLRGESLDAFVLISAFSSLLPAPQQGNYAAANAFLDGLARQRRARGEAGLAVNFGMWGEVGFALSEYGRRAHARLQSLGIARLSVAHGITALEHALAAGDVQVGVMPVDWARLFEADPLARMSPMLAELVARHAQAPEAVEAGRIVRALAQRLPAEQLGVLVEELRALVGKVLRMPAVDVPLQVPLTELGVDSLVAVEIKNRLQRDAGVDVSLTRLLEGPPVARLAEGILAQVKLAAMAEAAKTEGPVEEVEL